VPYQKDRFKVKHPGYHADTITSQLGRPEQILTGHFFAGVCFCIFFVPDGFSRQE